VLAIGLLQHEDPIYILEHDLVIMCLTVKFAEVTVKVETVITARYQHW